jgi:hypothetical protein
VVRAWCYREFGAELHDLQFQYRDRADRLWHDLQQVSTEFRPDILAAAGLPHNYDICTAAVTLISQHAVRCGLTQPLPYVTHYQHDSAQIRAGLSADLQIPVKTVKVLINAVCAGARISTHPDSAVCRLLKSDVIVISAVRDNPWILGLKSDIRACWRQISTAHGYTLNRAGHRKPWTSRQKWRCYFQQERAVQTAAQSYLHTQGLRSFWEHDGFRSDLPVNCAELQQHVFAHTGFQVQFSHEFCDPDRRGLAQT